MNERIEIVSDQQIRIKRCADGCCWTTIRSYERGIRFVSECDGQCGNGKVWWDAESQAALRDCINCLEARGSFAALSDESAVPFVGKRMRYRRSNGHADESVIEICVQARQGNEWILETPYGYCTAGIASSFLSLSLPKPRVRPFTPVEAAAYIGRELIVSGLFGCQSQKMKVKAAAEDCFFTNAIDIPYCGAAKTCIWVDDGSPCGIVEDQHG